MQPYLFPYLGYWQLITCGDIFVIFDDVNYIKRGWINRNNILLNGEAHKFTLPVAGASQNRQICEIELLQESKEKQKLLKTIENAYQKAPYFNKIFPIISEIIEFPEVNLVNFLENQFAILFSYLGISTQIIRSSSISKNSTLKGEDKIIEICQLLHADTYVNAIGGKELYIKKHFEEKNIQLYFIKMGSIQYQQFNNEFIPNLSIMDVLMFNERSIVQHLLQKYTLL